MNNDREKNELSSQRNEPTQMASAPQLWVKPTFERVAMKDALSGISGPKSDGKSVSS